MYLIQLLLSLYNSAGQRFPQARYAEVAHELTERFGGLTAYARAPAKGLWEERPGQTTHDDIVVYEVMVESLDTQWWVAYRKALEVRFDQDELVVRALEMRRL